MGTHLHPCFIGGEKVAEKATEEEIEHIVSLVDQISRKANELDALRGVLQRVLRGIERR